MSPERDGRCIALQFIRDGIVTTIGAPTEPDDLDTEATAVGLFKLLNAVYTPPEVDQVLAGLIDCVREDLERRHREAGWSPADLN
ncbi:hypothetical protein Pan44_37520 [Caulifigura coniformis]|uniref:Uncharacterized protein n=1 Tax=Caulifigura coniformis TaxID=2527983 RepID=A0A517SHV5_9PLAN|nr:hypothetical protein [Caulifigura coniformis]QDT55706.1 hypothetical protein Pan44_37520 [Caulifigura coniformis]